MKKIGGINENFSYWRGCFSPFDKINNCRQQKQLLWFLSNMTPKVLPEDLPGKTDALKRKKNYNLGAPLLKMAPHRRFGGSSVAEIFIFLSRNKNCPLFEKNFSILGSSKSYRPPQFFAQNESCSFFCIIGSEKRKTLLNEPLGDELAGSIEIPCKK